MQGRNDGAEFEGLQVGDAVRKLERDLEAAGVETPDRDARVLVAASLGATPADLILNPDRRLDAGEARCLAGYGRRRAAREPCSRILGEREFWGRKFRITPATLDPRPETETLIEAALEIAREEGWCQSPIRILDVGTGSGCLLLTLLAELPHAIGVGTDISAEALAVAEENSRRLGLSGRARFEQRGSLGGLCATFELLLCNPPYVATGAIATLPPEVRTYDPLAALDGGEDGLGAVRELAPDLVRVVPRGWSLFEVGAGQSDAVSKILREACPGALAIRVWTDLGDHVRCVAIQTHL